MAKTMKKCFGLALAMLMLMLAGTGMLTVQAEDNNLLVNGSFEELNGSGNPENWTIANESAVVVKEGDTGYVASPNGGKYMRLSKNNALIQQETNGAVASGNYLFSGYVKYAFAEAQGSSQKVGALVTFYCYGENGTMVIPQSKDNNYPIYSTRGEWRRFAFIISVPEGNTKILCALRHSNDINVTDLCYDGVSFEHVGDYDPDTLIQYNMEDVAKYNDVDVPTDMVVYSAYNTVGDMSYGTLGTNYRVATDTPDKSAYAMEMVNDGTVANGLSMGFHTGLLAPRAMYEVTGYIKVKSVDGYATIYTGRNRIAQDSLSAKATKVFYDTNDTWQKFSFYLQPTLKLDKDNYPAGTVAADAKGEHADAYTGYWRILFTGTGSVKFDDICITRVLDENRIGYNKNLAVGGDFESIGEMASGGIAKPDSAWTPAGTTAPTWTNNAEVENGVMMYKEADGNTALRVATSKDGGGYVYLGNVHMEPGKLYKLSWRQKADKGYISGGTYGSAKLNAYLQRWLLKDVGEFWSYADYPVDFGWADTDWVTYTQYIRYGEGQNPENFQLAFRPTIKGADGKYVFYIDDVELYMVDENEVYGTAAFSKEGDTVTVNRTLLHDGTTWAEWESEKSYDMVTVSYIVNGTKRQLYDIKIESYTASMLQGNTSYPKGLLPAATNASQEISVPVSGEYAVETYLWDGAGTLVPLVNKTAMPKAE